MPMNGEINDRFGIYKSVCCGSEIVIAEGAKFPDCRKHPKLPTKWNSITDEPVPHTEELPGRKKNNGFAA